MVRLGDIDGLMSCSSKLKFQFQYGAIGSDAFEIVHNDVTHVSIPVWCDWEQRTVVMTEDHHF